MRSSRFARLFTLMLICSIIVLNLQALITARAWNTLPPSSVTVAGDLQTAAGCGGNWDPTCSATGLTFDAEDQVWQRTFSLPAGAYQYKAALNGGWGENYGANSVPNGGNISLNLASAANVKFYYDHKTHWITENVSSRIVTAPGDFQSEMGCVGDWQPSCLRSWLEDVNGTGTYTRQITGLPANSYQVKAAINEGWSENYGAGGVANGPNIPFTVTSPTDIVKLSFVSATNTLTVTVNGAPAVPNTVTLVGDLQSEIGCGGDWDPACATSHMAYGQNNDIWQLNSTTIPAANYNFKVAINDAWTESYGVSGARNGGNIPFNKTTPTGGSGVSFFFDYNTKWVAAWDKDRSIDYTNPQTFVATVPGNFQSELGCPGDWQPDCMRSWLKGPYSDGNYYFFTNSLPAGTYQAKTTINQGWGTNFGAGGTPGGANIDFTVPATGTFMVFKWNPTTKVLDITSGTLPGDITKRKAIWVAKDTIAWNTANAGPSDTYQLSYSPTAALALGATGVTGGTTVNLTYDPAGLSPALQAKYPYIAGWKAYHVSSADLANFQAMIRSQLAISALNASNQLLDATGLQIFGALDDGFNYTGTLGVSFNSPPTLRVWAPTAQNVRLFLYADSNPVTAPSIQNMAYDSLTGVWSVTGNDTWVNQYYLYEVTVFQPTVNAVVTNLVTDPYSISVSMNGLRSQIVDLMNDATLKPGGWDTLAKPPLEAFTDIAIYELHVRDFSINDPTVSAANRGTYKAFTELNSNGMKHLARLAAAGLTHVHILPSFDIASVNENKTLWQAPNFAGCPPVPTSSQCYQAATSAVSGTDAFNWGYDPFHYNVPEGSYSTNADGPTRVLEFRQMVQALNGIGLRVVMDMVYNHTTASGQDPMSVLDRVVPGYYHRLNTDGNVETSSCCQNTASEHKMMGKLLIDSVLMWSTAYKVDGYRFDLMGHHMKSNMTDLRAALNTLTPAVNGVDGSKIYLYGEAWNFGEVANNARGVNAIQANMAGTGIGSFNDRARDGIRGGGPFDDVRYQGFATGLYYTPNTAGPAINSNKDELLRRTDWVKVGIAATLKNYVLVDRFGNTIPASQLDYQGQQAGYTQDPQEVINYISAHDNETLWDAVQYKAALSADIMTRIRYNNLGLATVLLSQGVPFFHAGDDILRSKSMDRNSYNSGDWFNAIDWSLQTNTWAVGAPPAGDNSGNWPVITPLLDNSALRVTPTNINFATVAFQEMLMVRKSSRLFRLTTGTDIQQRLAFLNNGPNQVPGLIVYTLDNRSGTNLDPNVRFVVVVINATPTAQTFSDASLRGIPLTLHPTLANSIDPLRRASTYNRDAGSVTVEGLTVAVFVDAVSGWAPGYVVPTATGAGTPSSLPSTGYAKTDSSTSPTVPTLLLIGAAGFIAFGVVTTLRKRR